MGDTDGSLYEALQDVVNIVAVAGRVAREVGASLERVRELTKDDRSPVTVADFAVQAVVSLAVGRDERLRAPIVGEERAGALRQDAQEAVRRAVVDAVRSVESAADEGRVLDAIDACDHDATAEAYWALDPIDGTKGFLRGQQYAIALAYIRRGRVELGVIGCPHLPLESTASLDKPDAVGSIYGAARGAGCFAFRPDGAAGPQRVSAAHYEQGAPVRICESVEAKHSNQQQSQRILEHLGGAPAPVRLDSQCKYAVVARGQADAYLRLPTRADYVEKIWDHAAGMLIAAEAGALVSDIDGRPLDFSRGPLLQGNRGVICAASGLHPRLVEAVGAVAG